MSDQKLSEYHCKRRPGATPEPFGSEDTAAVRPGLFVVQLHAARRRHYDLRLEIDGVLASWALPKGPSLNPQEKRLAVATENHPVEYGDFEGVIPQGNYGAGSMIVWDRGRCRHHLDPREGLEAGKLLFELEGAKLRGLWTLVQHRKKGEPSKKEWLLIKKPDAAATGEDADELPAASLLSGLTVEELAEGPQRSRELASDLAAAEVPTASNFRPEAIRPMLARTAPEPFDREGWLFELKYDGYRMLAVRDRDGIRLRSRNGIDCTALFPELVRAPAALPAERFVLDGEVVALDEAGRPDFHRLQQRARYRRDLEVERAAVESPVVLYVFDLLALGTPADGSAGTWLDLRSLSLKERKAALQRLLPELALGPVRYADHIEERGAAVFAEVERLGVEGVMAKRMDARYRAGRSPAWLKIRADRVEDFVVVGFDPRGQSFRTLHLGQWDEAERPGLHYAGRVGSGLGARERRQLRESFEPRSAGEAACRNAPDRPAAVWVEPRQVVEVRYTERTRGGSLRHPSLLRIRQDKAPEECIAPEDRLDELPEPATSSPRPASRLQLTNQDKIFWPEDGTTKGDLLAYYKAASPFLLPYLKDRPAVLDRYPDGIEGKNFFQKNAPDFVPDWVRTASWRGEAGGSGRAFVAEDVDSLLYLVNLGSIPLHIASARLGAAQKPDWCILDLDAKDAPFSHVIQVARALHRLCRKIDLPCYPKTSGATGLHLLIPLGRQVLHEQARQLAGILAAIVAAELDEIASTARLPKARPGKVYVDALQNGYGKLLVAPFSARPRHGAPVSMPLRWGEVTKGLDPNAFNLRSAPQRLAAWAAGKGDPLAPVLDEVPDLQGALARLAERTPE